MQCIESCEAGSCPVLVVQLSATKYSGSGWRAWFQFLAFLINSYSLVFCLITRLVVQLFGHGLTFGNCIICLMQLIWILQLYFIDVKNQRPTKLRRSFVAMASWIVSPMFQLMLLKWLLPTDTDCTFCTLSIILKEFKGHLSHRTSWDMNNNTGNMHTCCTKLGRLYTVMLSLIGNEHYPVNSSCSHILQDTYTMYLIIAAKLQLDYSGSEPLMM